MFQLTLVAIGLGAIVANSVVAFTAARRRKEHCRFWCAAFLSTQRTADRAELATRLVKYPGARQQLVVGASSRYAPSQSLGSAAMPR